MSEQDGKFLFDRKDEVLSLFCSGPAAGGGYRCNVTGQVNTASVLVPRGPVEAQVRAEEVSP